MGKILQEALIYLVVAISSLFILGFATHMLVGGLVSPETEYLLIELVCFADVIVIGFMTWDVIKRRKQHKQ